MSGIIMEDKFYEGVKEYKRVRPFHGFTMNGIVLQDFTIYGKELDDNKFMIIEKSLEVAVL